MSISNNSRKETTPLLSHMLESSSEEPRLESETYLSGNVDLPNRRPGSAIYGSMGEPDGQAVISVQFQSVDLSNGGSGSPEHGSMGEPDGQIAVPRGIILLLLYSIGGINVVNGTYFYFYRLQGVLKYKDCVFGNLRHNSIKWDFCNCHIFYNEGYSPKYS